MLEEVTKAMRQRRTRRYERYDALLAGSYSDDGIARKEFAGQAVFLGALRSKW
jgi:hypothetical protein